MRHLFDLVSGLLLLLLLLLLLRMSSELCNSPGNNASMPHAGFDGSVCVWDVSLNANNEPHLLHTWQAHASSEILAMVHDPMKNVIITAGNDCTTKVAPVAAAHGCIPHTHTCWA